MAGSGDDLVASIKEEASKVELRLATKRSLLEARKLNSSPDFVEEDELTKLDSSLKKNTALNKKLRGLTASTWDQVAKDIQNINQSMFLPEAASALLQATTKASVVQWVLKAAQEIHRRYAAFKEEFSSALKKELESALDLGDTAAVGRRRACIKLAIDVEKAAMLKTVHMVKPTIRQVVQHDLKKKDGTPVAAISLMTSFVRTAKDHVLGFSQDVLESLPEGLQDLQALKSSADKDVAAEATVLAEKIQQLRDADKEQLTADAESTAVLKEAVKRVFENACGILEQWHSDLCAREQKNAKLLVARGAVPTSVQQAYDEQKALFASFHSGLEAFGAALMQDLPALSKQQSSAEDTNTVHVVSTAGLASAAEGLWDDDHMAYFYTNLPNLINVVPSMALHNGREDAGKEEEEGKGGDMDRQVTAGSDELARVEQAEDGGDAAKEEEKESDAGSEGQGEEDAAASVKGEGQAGAQTMRDIYEQLAACTTSERADELAVNFCFIQTKNRRKLLAQHLGDLFKVPLQLLPFYARIVATLTQEYPDIGTTVGSLVVRKVRSLAKKVDATHKTVEPRVLSARYLAELAKFRVVDPGEFFVCLKRCLDDFTGHNIDTACELVVGAGAFMMRQSETNERMESMLGIMLKHRTGRQLDAAKAWNIENAYLACHPRAHTSTPERRTPLQRYIRKLVFSCVQQQEGKVEKLVRHMRRLPWDECEHEVLTCTLEAALTGSFDRLCNLGSLMAALNKYRPSLVVALVDILVEDVVSSLQNPALHTPQGSISVARLICELYNFQVIKTAHLFSILYLYLTLGHRSPEESDMLDPSDSFVRVRAIFTMLQSSGHYFTSGNTHGKLKKYFVFLQRYILLKEELPSDLRTTFHQLHSKLLPASELYATYEDADKAVRVYLSNGRHGRESVIPDAEENDALLDNQAEQELPASTEAEVDAVDESDSAQQAEDALFEKELASLFQGQGTRHPGLDPLPAAQPQRSSPVCFRVRLKKQGGRGDDQSHRLELPSSSSIAAHLHEHRTEEELERSRMKELVLAAEANQSDDQGALPGRRPEHGRGKSYLGARRGMEPVENESRNDRSSPLTTWTIHGAL